MPARSGALPPSLPLYHGWFVVAAAFLVALYGFGLGFYGPGIYLVALTALHGWPTVELSLAITSRRTKNGPGRDRRDGVRDGAAVRRCGGQQPRLPVLALQVCRFLSRLARSYSQARSSHLRAAIASLRLSAVSAGSIRYRSRGSTVRASASVAKLVALSGKVETSALAVRSTNSSSVNADPTAR